MSYKDSNSAEPASSGLYSPASTKSCLHRDSLHWPPPTGLTESPEPRHAVYTEAASTGLYPPASTGLGTFIAGKAVPFSGRRRRVRSSIYRSNRFYHTASSHTASSQTASITTASALSGLSMTQYAAIHISTYSFCVVEPIKDYCP